MPVVTGRFYEVAITLTQTAVCQGVSGAALAVSNVAFDFPLAFFTFV